MLSKLIIIVKVFVICPFVSKVFNFIFYYFYSLILKQIFLCRILKGLTISAYNQVFRPIIDICLLKKILTNHKAKKEEEEEEEEELEEITSPLFSMIRISSSRHGNMM
jgi:hypothetical protein